MPIKLILNLITMHECKMALKYILEAVYKNLQLANQIIHKYFIEFLTRRDSFNYMIYNGIRKNSSYVENVR